MLQINNSKSKKISVAVQYHKSKSGSFDYVLLDGTKIYEYAKWSNSAEALEREKARITKINNELGNKLIIVKTRVQDFY